MKILKVIKKVLVFGLATLGAIAVIGMFIPDEWVEETEEQTHEVTQDETTEEEYIEEEEEVVEEEEEVDLSTVFNAETVSLIIETSMKDYFDYVEVEADDETKSVNIKVTNDGMATAFQQIQMGYVDESNWDLVKNSTDECVATLLNEYKEDWGIEHISIQVLNDLDKEKMLYMTLNGKSVYDALESL